jgi:flagellar motility protein MotE (MotC chaperone)
MNTEALRADLEGLMASLREREAQLDKRAQQIADRMQALAIAEEQIDLKLAELQEAEEGLSSTLSLVETAAETDLARLTSVYENMKPKDAAALFEEMAPEFAAGFLGRMRPDAAAKVLTGLSPQAAYSISVILAGRNARAPGG